MMSCPLIRVIASTEVIKRVPVLSDPKIKEAVLRMSNSSHANVHARMCRDSRNDMSISLVQYVDK